MKIWSALLVAAVLGVAQTRPANGLRIYVVDVEGGGATLVVAPSGDSMLVDSGSPGPAAERDSKRIADARRYAAPRPPTVISRRRTATTATWPSPSS